MSPGGLLNWRITPARRSVRDRVGVGTQSGAHQSDLASLRFQHLLNDGLGHPNPGVNFSEIYFQYNV
ncbi:acyloxyacyl hydrolase [Paraburkholderia silviterrae]|uniref:Acyloxyacyl hydrolase n=1 Tax=Paraburkholderia silviterrae TaxID=2528715 RepID=A0A4R5MAI3_9BURK|nr:acyloxyacyl hydrolase [Paraburkholderia silviterrae]